MDSKLPVGFYSKTHLTTFLAGIAASIFVDIMIIMMINDETYGSLTPQKVRDIIARLKDEALKEAAENV